MTRLFITASGLDALAGRLRADGRRVVAPLARPDGTVEYGALEEGASPALNGSPIPRRSLKEYFLPPTEPLFRWRGAGGAMRLSPGAPPPVPTVVLAARPCDAAALPVLDRVMDWDYHDEPWFARRAATTILALACRSGQPGCFCTAVGLTPDATRGADVRLVAIEGGFIADTVTRGGEELAAAHPDLFHAASDAALEEAEQRQATARASVGGAPSIDAALVGAFLPAHFDDPLWAELARRCHGCGACAAVCPTCHCFDIVDEPDGPDRGTRRRNWDTCQAGKFTLHASGHNPRGTQSERFRQRVQHKFAIYPRRFDETLCTGCGRCARACPAGMDLPEVLGLITARAREEAAR